MGLFEARTDTGGGDKGRGLGTERPGERLNIAFGLERMAFLGIRFPLPTVAALALLVVVAVLGIGRLTVDDSLSELFRADTPEFKTFEAESRKFPSNEY